MVQFASHLRPGGQSADRNPSEQFIQLWMAPVVGNINGKMSGKRLFDARITVVPEGEPFAISLSAIQSGLAGAAKEATAGAIEFRPAQTRVARLGVIAEAVSRPGAYFSTSLLDQTSRQTRILFYVDRRCVIHGSISDHVVDLTVARPGLHWVELPHDAGGRPLPSRLADSQQGAVVVDVTM